MDATQNHLLAWIQMSEKNRNVGRHLELGSTFENKDLEPWKQGPTWYLVPGTPKSMNTCPKLRATCTKIPGTISEEVFAAKPPTDRAEKLVYRARRALYGPMGPMAHGTHGPMGSIPGPSGTLWF